MGLRSGLVSMLPDTRGRIGPGRDCDDSRCCDDCCPAEEEGSNGHGGGCNQCSSAQGLVLPRVGEGILGIQVAVIVDAMLEEVKEMDDREVAEALRFVLHVTRGDPYPKTFESMLD